MLHLCLFRCFLLFPTCVLYFVARFLGGGSGSGSALAQILELLRSANLQAKETYAATVSEKVRSTREPIIGRKANIPPPHLLYVYYINIPRAEVFGVSNLPRFGF